MNNKKRLLLILFSFLIFLCLVGFLWNLIEKRGAYKANPIRPSDFPDILIAPPNAVLIDHSTPSNSQIVSNTYSLWFIVNDPYPSEETYKFVEKYLISNGWKRLKHDLLNPKQTFPKFLSRPQRFDLNGIDSALEKRIEKYPYSHIPYRREDWINKTDDHIEVSMSYKLDRVMKKVKFDNVCVNLTLFKRDSLMGPKVERYREVHPEEFAENKSIVEERK